MEFLTLDQFDAMMRALEFARQVTKRGDRYFPGPLHRASTEPKRR
jgi:hypothetical protein